MEVFTERRETTINARLVSILPGNPPRINWVTNASGRNGAKRHFTRQVSILDGDLSARLRQEASVGDSLRVTVASECCETGSVTYLIAFKRVLDVEQEMTVSNRGIDIIQSEIEQFTHPPVRDPKEKVKH